MTINPQLPDSWLELLDDEFSKEYFYRLKHFLLEEKRHHQIFPRGNHIFNAFNNTSPENIKVVILGQDPYHGEHQAHGLSFSVQDGIPFPPSLQNIFQELRNDLGCKAPTSGNLSLWAKQGVFLLNTVLTVRANSANSHRNQGWEQFTDVVISKISESKKNVVFILWGRPAQQKSALIDQSKHLIIRSVHPSPLSAYRGFFGSKPFSQANIYLESKGLQPVSWCL